MLPNFVILLLSGGVDSVVLLYDLLKQGVKVHALLFDYGQRHVQELTWARHHCHKTGTLFTTIGIPQLKGSSLTDGKGGVVVPFRNGILLSHAVPKAVQAGAEAICYACNQDDEEVFPDCRRPFVQAYNHLLLMSHIPIEVCTPYIDLRKWEIIDKGIKLGVNMTETWSCYKGGNEPCGECLACKTRDKAMFKASVNP